MIKITDNARSHLLDLLMTSERKAIVLSIGSKGCGGHSYKLDFGTPDPSDEVVALDDDHCVIIDRASMLWLFGVQVDFVDDDLGSHFDFVNSLEASRCGCNQSFTLKPC